MASIYIVEDDMIIAADISMQLTKLGYTISGISIRAEDALLSIDQNPPDLVLMDINLSGKMNGIEASAEILEKNQIPVIFLTSNSDDATFQAALKTKPYAFISKPFQKAQLERAIGLVANRINSEANLKVENSPTEKTDHISTMEDRLFIRHNGQMVKVTIDDILYVEADRTYCKVVTRSKEFLLSIPVSKFEVNLPSSTFLRIHRSFLVNLSKIDAVSEYQEFVTIGTKQLPVSRRQKDELVKRLKLV